jgi:oligopeptide/dipeptide ABC transporter ATP-binding protein
MHVTPTPDDVLLRVEDLKTYFVVNDEEIRAVDGASFVIRRGRTLAIVGESGCGKSVTAYSILRLIQKPGRIAGGRIILHPLGEPSGAATGIRRKFNVGTEPVDIAALDERSELLFQLRGGVISMIFQEPMTALSPVHTVGNQICEAILLHQKVTAKEAEALAVEMLGKVGIPAPATRLRQYPHEMSGGMRQRVVIAMALVCQPWLLIADEPTTALDVTIQAQVLQLIKKLQEDTGTSTLLITHDLGVVAQTADEVAVMYLGRIVEQSAVIPLFRNPRHPYTRALMQSLPSLSKGRGSRLPSIQGSVPSLTDIPPGCPFHPRCQYAQAGRCDVGHPPPLETLAEDHKVACLRAMEI